MNHITNMATMIILWSFNEMALLYHCDNFGLREDAAASLCKRRSLGYLYESN